MAVGGLTKLVRFGRYLTAEKGRISGVGIGGYFAARRPWPAMPVIMRLSTFFSLFRLLFHL
jgi:hypothetical protein